MKEIDKEDRPREKLLRLGPNGLSKAELLAIQIGSGLVGTNAKQIAERLLRDSDNNFYRLYNTLLNNIGVEMTRDDGETSQVAEDPNRSVHDCQLNLKGIGPAKKAHILSCLEIGIRMIADKKELQNKNKQLNCSDSIYDYIFPDLYNLPHEELWLILLNQKGVTQAKIRISIGGISSSTADIRVILRTALRLGHPSLALVHNHPGGSIRPSKADDELTQRLYNATQIIGLNFLDHIIFTDEQYYSYFNENRFLEWTLIK